MLKKNLMALALGLVLAGSALWAGATPLRIGFVDVSQVFDEHPETKKATNILNAEIEKQKAKIDILQGEIAKLKEDKEILEDEGEQIEKQALIDQKTDELKEYTNAARTYLTQREQQLTKEIIEKIYGAVREVAIKEKISIVVEKSNILYGSSEVDLTGKVIEVLRGE